jgi:hypothetical protein
MFKVYLDSVRQSLPDSEGATLTVIGEFETLAFEGDAIAAADYLQYAVPIGKSVCVRYPGGLRSCMNKPALWADIRKRADNA